MKYAKCVSIQKEYRSAFPYRAAKKWQKNVNPRLGIEGGLSVLGTSGIVVPMSEKALIASIRLEMEMKRKNGAKYLLLTPGNYGADFVKENTKLDVESSMKCSNYVGETLDMAVELGFLGVLFVAHIGKFVKVSGGIMNTHSRHSDARAELMCAHACDPELILRRQKRSLRPSLQKKPWRLSGCTDFRMR